jgi:RND family efflux transporter MFP subunit
MAFSLSRQRALLALAALTVLAAAGLAWALLRPAPLPTVPVTAGEVEVRITGPGTVQARVPVTVSARVSSQIVSLHADHGDTVARGQLLARLDDRDLAARRAAAVAGVDAVKRNIAAAEASVAKARADFELARSRGRRDSELRTGGFISDSAYEASALSLESAAASLDTVLAQLAARRAEERMAVEEARYARAQWSHTQLVSPIDGLVIQRAAEVGAIAAPGAALFKLVDPATLWVAARIDESQIGRLQEGQPARIRLRSGGEYAGHVARISRQSDAATRELEVNVAFDAPPARFAIDQEAEVEIRAGIERGLVVPVAALRPAPGGSGVKVLRDGHEVLQPVRLGASDGTQVVVAAGLAPDDRLVAWTSR